MVAADNVLKSLEHVSEASKARIPIPMKKYATVGKNIPLKKNWSESWCTLSAHFETVSDPYRLKKLFHTKFKSWYDYSSSDIKN